MPSRVFTGSIPSRMGCAWTALLKVLWGLVFPVRELKKRFKSGDIAIEGRAAVLKANSRVKKGEVVELIIKKTVHEDEYWNGKLLPLAKAKVLYEDEQICAIAKPPFMATHPTGRHLFNCATVFLEKLISAPAFSMHRLDRETSGVLLLAKNSLAASKITPLFEAGQVRKAYFFIGVKRRVFKVPIQFDACERLGALNLVYIKAYPSDSNEGKEGHTRFHLLREIKGDGGLVYILGLAYPKTGRQHQIRVHAMAHNFPLLGDKLYYGSFKLFQRFKDKKASAADYQYMELPRQALHALAINLPYPDVQSNKRQTFFCPIPNDLKEWMRARLDFGDKDLNALEAQLQDLISSIQI